MPAMSDDFPEPDEPVMRMRCEVFILLICDGVGLIEWWLVVDGRAMRPKPAMARWVNGDIAHGEYTTRGSRIRVG